MNRLIEEANILLQGQGFSYAICGGFALDLFLGYETRTHGDIDILAFWEDRETIITYMQSKGFCVYEMLGGGKVHRITDIRVQEKLRKNIFCYTEDCELVRLYDTEEQDVYWLDFQHIGLSKLNYIEFLFNEKTEDEFVYIRDNRVKRKLERTILEKDGIPYLAPELCLLFKSTDIEREGYQQDFELTVKELSKEQKDWFEKAMKMLYPEGHKWRKMERIVKRDDWENKPMPRQCAEFLFARQFTEEQYAILIRGHIPEAMEDKWFWYYENGTLYVHRSWTGFCIYVITFDMESGIHKVIVNRDESQYSETSLEHEKVILNNLLKWWTESKYDYYNQWLCETADNLRQQSSCGNSKQETVFEILGIEDKELPVSNLFAYYFDEERNDLCGREFLNLFLDLADVSGILEEDTYVIKREWQMIHEEYKTSIDILVIVGEEKNPKRIICIENKINSEEGENQTERYFKAVEAHFQRCEEKDYLYFTKNNSSVELSSNKFKHIRYRDIREILSRSPFDAMMYAKDFCIYYIDKEEQLFSYIECNDREINSCDEKAFQMLAEYIVWKVNSLRQFENIFCEQKVSAKSAECFYRMYQFEWCFELNVNPDEKRKMNIHLEGYRNGISLHMETMPYEPFSKIKNRYGDVFFDTYVSLRNKLREKMNFEDRDGYECVKIQGNADLSIAKFKVNANTYKEYFDILMKLMDTVGERVSKCIKME